MILQGYTGDLLNKFVSILLVLRRSPRVAVASIPIEFGEKSDNRCDTKTEAKSRMALKLKLCMKYCKYNLGWKLIL